MRIQSFNHELTFANICFSRLFRNITINRRTAKDKVDPIKVMCVLGSRSRIMKALENQQEKADFTLPLIAISRTGIVRDPSRLANMNNEIKYYSNKIVYDLLTPNPININYKVTVFAKYQSDIDLILSNWIPFFNDDVWISTKHYKFTDLKFLSQVVMDNSISETKNESPQNSEYDFVTAECSFVFKTCIFGGNRKFTSVGPTDISGGGGPGGGGGDGPEPPDPPDGPDGPDLPVPLIKSIHFELHAVPKYDPYLWDKYHVLEYLDIGTYFEEVDNNFIIDPEYDNLDWMFVDMSADIEKNKDKYGKVNAGYQWKWTLGGNYPTREY